MDKDMLKQNTEGQAFERKSRWNHIDIFDMFDDGEYFWFSSIEYNALFKMSKHTFDIDYIGSFPNEESYGYRLYTSINECNGKLFFTPCSAYEIGVYDMKTRRFEKINIGISRSQNDLSEIKYAKKFVSGFIYNNTLILIPCCYDCIVVYDTITGKITFQKELFEYFYEKYSDYTTSLDAQFYLCWFAKRINESEIVFNLHCNKNILVFYNFETEEFTEQIIGTGKETFSLVEYDDGQVYIYDTCGDTLVKWEIETGRYLDCHIGEQLPGFQPCGLENSFLNMSILGDWLYLIPANTNVAVKVNTETLVAIRWDALSTQCSIAHKGLACLNLCRVFDNKLYLFANQSKELLAYGTDGGLQHIRVKPPAGIEAIVAENHLVDLIRNGCRLFNENHIPLDRFINAVAKLEMGEHSMSSTREMNESCGSDIYRVMKRSLLK